MNAWKATVHLACLDVRHAEAQLALAGALGEIQMFVAQLQGPAAELYRDAQNAHDRVVEARACLSLLHNRACGLIARAREANDIDSGSGGGETSSLGAVGPPVVAASSSSEDGAA